MKTLRSAFTLIELLIVIAIIGILAGLVSSAIVKVTRTAATKRAENNGRRLQSAITEYWHDMGYLPLTTDKNELKKILKIVKNVKVDPETQEKTVSISYRVVFCGDNNAVVQMLLSATLPDGNPKSFLDLHGFQTPVKQNGTWPCTEVADAWLVYNGEAVDSDGKRIPRRDDPVLAYFTKLVRCPECERVLLAQPGAVCRKEKIMVGGRQEEVGCGHIFSKAELDAAFSGAMPYVIEFDVDNNIILVRNDPSEAAKLTKPKTP
jgi:prepilin-type N-terminal cleavage/methylation domain-containing protein